MKVAKHQWSVCEEDLFVHVLPAEDIAPHGVRITDTVYELSHICNCGPKIESANRNGEVFKKPVVIHNSFEQNKYLDDIIKHQ